MDYFNIYSKIEAELEDFNTTSITIVGGKTDGLRYLEDTGDYTFSQRETLDLIDLYYNSKFQTGNIDSEGQEKVFLNVVSFRTDVAIKMIDVGVKDFTFIPMNGTNEWGSWLLQEDFKQYSQKENFGQLINELEKDYAKYGSCVVKKVGKELERVPVKNLINSQQYATLMEAVEADGYVIEEHDYSQYELDQYAKLGWDISGLDLQYGQRVKCYERYGLVPESLVKKGGDPIKQVLAMAIVLISPRKKKDDPAIGTILFIEKITELPYREAHWDKQDGRWLGIGNVERQFENQIARNVIANLRRRAMYWSSKHIFQSTDETIAKNLVIGAKDGDVLAITPTGQITQVDMASRQLAEFNSEDQLWENNSNQLSFTYDVATGENLPSGTPFRLGAILSNAVSSHFAIKKENFAFFLRDTFFDLMVPIFKKRNREHILTISQSKDGIERLREQIISHYTGRLILDTALNKGELITPEEARQRVEQQISKRKYLAMEIIDDFYSDVESYVQLEITGEGINTATKIQSLTSILELLAKNPQALDNPVTKSIITKILGYTGDSLESVIGVQQPQQQQAMQLAGQQAPQQQVQQLMQSNPLQQ